MHVTCAGSRVQCMYCMYKKGWRSGVGDDKPLVLCLTKSSLSILLLYHEMFVNSGVRLTESHLLNLVECQMRCAFVHEEELHVVQRQVEEK